ncbi:MAG: hypothetical protein HY958_07160 [Bacteroidia bacterium]|nr:hypothetical protein [Bacteroidia bacterium]
MKKLSLIFIIINCTIINLFATNVTITQDTASTQIADRGRMNIEILRITIFHIGGGSPHDATVTQMNFTPANTNNADILQAKLYFTTSTTFDTTTQLGTADFDLSNGLSFTFSQTIARNSSGYFWLAYDLANNVTPGNILDATQVQTDITISEPIDSYTINSNGNRTIVDRGCWLQKADCGDIRYQAVGFTIGTKGYIGTGWGSAAGDVLKDFWEWDPGTNIWTQKADFGGGLRYKASGFSIGTKGYIGTGIDAGTTDFNDFWEYDTSTNTWTQKADFGGAIRELAVGFSIGTKGYIGTGIKGSSTYYNDFWEYDPFTDLWTQKANFGGTGRYSAVGFSIGTKGYIGTGTDGSKTNDFWEYDPSTDVWTQKANFGGSTRYRSTGFSIGTKGYIGIGENGGYFADFFEYDPSTDLWTQKADFAGAARSNAVGFSIGTKGYIGTGRDGTSPSYYFKDFWEYTPDDICVLYNGIVSLDLPVFTGSIQWQESLDGTSWADIPGATYQPYQFNATSQKYYRAKIINGSCNPVYSPVKRVNIL